MCQSPSRGTGISTTDYNGQFRIGHMCQSPSRGTGISTTSNLEAIRDEKGVNPLPGEPAFLLGLAQQLYGDSIGCQSPSRGTGISTTPYQGLDQKPVVSIPFPGNRHFYKVVRPLNATDKNVSIPFPGNRHFYSDEDLEGTWKLSVSIPFPGNRHFYGYIKFWKFR